MDIAASEDPNNSEIEIPLPIVEAIDGLIADYSGYPDLANAVLQIGEQYYRRGYTKDYRGLAEGAEYKWPKVIAVMERLVNELEPIEPFTPHGFYFAAVSYGRMGNSKKAAEYMETVVARWPDYVYAWNAQCFIGIFYEEMKKTGQLLETEANERIVEAYRGVVEKYRDSSLFDHAALALGRLYFRERAWADSAYYLERFFEDEPDDFRVPHTLLQLARCYDNMGDGETAVGVYQEIARRFPEKNQGKSARARLAQIGGER